MNQLFKEDSIFMNMINRIGDFVILNICFVISCIPVITLGPALTSLYYVGIKLYQKEEIEVGKCYFKALKDNMKSGFGIGLIMLFFALMFGLDLWIFLKSDVEFNGFIIMGVVITLVLYLLIYVYLFPLMARYENKTARHVKNAFLMSLKHFPKTILIISIHLISLILMVLLVSLRPLFLVFGFSTLMYWHVSVLMPMFNALEDR